MFTREYSEVGRRMLIRVVVTLNVLMLCSLFGAQSLRSAQGQESGLIQQGESGQNGIAAGTNQDFVGERAKPNTVVIELFYRSDSEQSQNAKKYLHELQTGHSGIEVKTYDVLEDKQQLARL